MVVQCTVSSPAPSQNSVYCIDHGNIQTRFQEPFAAGSLPHEASADFQNKHLTTLPFFFLNPEIIAEALKP